jgi:hypothetical protein
VGFIAKGGRSGPRPRALNSCGMLRTGEWLMSDMPRELKMSAATLHRWSQVGWVHARKLPVPDGRWAIWADRKELKRKSRLHQFRRGCRAVGNPPFAQHGSWLTVAEIELSVLSRQCLDRRIESMKKLCCEVAAWEETRNERQERFGGNLPRPMPG